MVCVNLRNQGSTSHSFDDYSKDFIWWKCIGMCLCQSLPNEFWLYIAEEKSLCWAYGTLESVAIWLQL